MSPARSNDSPVEHDLLFALLALETEIIPRPELTQAMHAWIWDQSKPLGDFLVERGTLSSQARQSIDRLVESHVKGVGRASPSDTPLPGTEAGIATPATSGTAVRNVAAIPDAELGSSSSSGLRFHIIREHAHGGLGKVYLALDKELNREVALKQIRERYADDESSRARFMLEAEVTGALEHPGVVPVYGLGTTADGRQFYAMRFVRGESFKDAIQRFHAKRASDRNAGEMVIEFHGLLRRFVDVCNTLGYAHSRGILHRDLKPSNIMLGKFGETLVVDWGLAKVLVPAADGTAEHQQHTADHGLEADGTLRPRSSSGIGATLVGSAVGTPPYSSPEQAAGKLDELTPASDIYSLGATLYCLLTGQAPFDGSTVKEGTPQLPNIGCTRPRSLNRQIPASLEAICMKAMATNPKDRYGSASALAADLEKWLANEPVSAYPEPFSDRARRWLGRHRSIVTGALAAVIVGIACLTTMLVLVTASGRREHEARLEAARERDQAVQLRERAVASEKDAQKSAAESQSVLQFFQQKVLAAARPLDQEGGLGKDVTVRAAVEAAETQIPKAFVNQPTTEAAIRHTLGETYLFLGDPKPGITQLEKARTLRQANLGADHPDTLDSANSLASAYQLAGYVDRALPLLEETLKKRQAKLGPDHAKTWESMNNLAVAYRAMGRVAEAIPLYEKALKERQEKLGAEHPQTLITMSNLAKAYKEAGRLPDAIALHEQTLKIRQTKLGPDHANTLTSMNNLADAYEDAGRLAEAIPLYEQTLAVSKSKLGLDHIHTLQTMDHLAAAYTAAGRASEGLALEEQALSLKKAKLGLDHPDTLTSMGNLAKAYQAAGRESDAIAMFEDTLKRQKVKLGPQHRDTLVTMDNLSNAYLKQKKYGEAESLLRQMLSIQKNKQQRSWQYFDTESRLGGSLVAQNKFAEAEPLLVAGYDSLKEREREIPPKRRIRIREALARVVQLYDGWGKTDKASEWRKELTKLDNQK
jgi:serine/threonine protein kinase/tetratricopeptide (TPR) repeat protein